LAQRSRKRRKTGASGNGRAPVSRAERREASMAEHYAKRRAREEEIRRKLRPLAPGERPLALKLAAALAALLAVGNIAALLAGLEVDGERPVAGALIFAALMLAAAVGLWQRRYWAVLGFEALLGISLVYAALSLMLAGNLAAVALCLAVFAIAGPLFWFLIRVMSRIQLPTREAER
jgi:hypothetical protein